MNTAFKLFVFFLCLNFTFFHSVFPSSCCGSGGNLSSLILGDYRTQLGVQFINQAVASDTNENREILKRNRNQEEIREELNFNFATLLNDKLQLLSQAQIVKNTKNFSGQQESTTGLANLGFGLGYEIFPAYSFSPWRPRVFVAAGHSIPFGNSIDSTEQRMATDAISSGYHETFGEVLAQNRFRYFTTQALGRLTYSHPKNVDGDRFKRTPGTFVSFEVRSDLGSEDFVFISGISQLRNGQRENVTTGDISVQEERNRLNLGVAYQMPVYSVAILYFDEEVFPGKNSEAFRGASLQFQRFWEL